MSLLIECEHCSGTIVMGAACYACIVGRPAASDCMCRERYADESGVRRMMRDITRPRFGSLHMCPDCQESCDCEGPPEDLELDEEERECVHTCDPWAKMATEYERMR